MLLELLMEYFHTREQHSFVNPSTAKNNCTPTSRCLCGTDSANKLGVCVLPTNETQTTAVKTTFAKVSLIGLVQ